MEIDRTINIDLFRLTQVAKKTPTQQTYDSLQAAFTHFNKRLFGGRLPDVVITLARKSSEGFFAGGRFGPRGATTGEASEISLNPTTFAKDPQEVLAALVHEMVHLDQYCAGEAGARGYHGRLWAMRMREIGLVPSSTGRPGGRQIGFRMGHYIKEDGPFARACGEFLARNPTAVPYVERWGGGTNKTKYACPDCHLNVWGRGGLAIQCADCDQRLLDPDELEAWGEERRRILREELERHWAEQQAERERLLAEHERAVAAQAETLQGLLGAFPALILIRDDAELSVDLEERGIVPVPDDTAAEKLRQRLTPLLRDWHRGHGYELWVGTLGGAMLVALDIEQREDLLVLDTGELLLPDDILAPRLPVDPLISQAAVLRRPGWTRERVKRLLGEPDELVPSSRYPVTVRLYRLSRVFDAETQIGDLPERDHSSSSSS